MEKIKSFLKDYKKTAMLGLIAYLIIAIYELFYVIKYPSYYFNVYSITSLLGVITDISLFVYFGIVCNRLYRKKGNIEFAKKFLLFSVIILTIVHIGYSFYYGIAYGNFLNYITSFSYIKYIAINVITCWFYLGLFKPIKKKVNNKVYVVVILLNVIYNFATSGIFSIQYLLINIIGLMHLPYFYRYFDLLKENKKNK